MRVALIAPPYESVPPRLYGGTERVVANLCRGLVEADVDVTVFASGDSHCEGRLVATIPESLRLRETPVLEPAHYHLATLSKVAARLEGYDVIHNHDDVWMLPLSLIPHAPPLLTTLHGRLDWDDPATGIGSYRHLPYVSISDSQRTPLPKLNWAATVRHGLPLEEFPFYPDPGRYLAFLGRMSPEKGAHLAIEIARRTGIPLKLAAKIEGPSMRNYFDTYVRPHLDGVNVEYVGEISEHEKAEFLGNALALVFPIDWPEPFGLVMIESLAFGTPVLARPLGAVPEVLCEGVTGYSDLSVDRLCREASLRISKISRGGCRRWVQEHFSLERMTEAYLDVYRSLTKEQRAPAHRRNFLHSVERSSS